MNPIRLMLVISNLEFGGAQRQLVELVNNLGDEFDVTVVSLSDYAPLGEDLHLKEKNFLVIRKRAKYDFAVALKLAREARRRGIQVLHAYLFDAEIAARLAGWIARTPVVIGSERNSDYRIKKNQMLAYWLTHRLRKHCIANSQRGAEFNAEALSYPPSHYSVVLNGVNIERFKPGKNSECRRRLGVKDDEFLIGMFASFKSQKNHPMLYRAAQRLMKAGRRFRLLMVGEELHGGAQGTSGYYSSIRDLGKRLGIEERCIYVGNIHKVQEYYLACDVSVLPSRFEGTPNVVLESLACGVPAIVTRVSSNEQIIENEVNGYLVELDDDDALCERIETLMQNDDLRRQLAAGARRTAEEKFSSQIFAQNTAAVYRQLLLENQFQK